MKRALVLILGILASVEALHAACTGEACRDEVGWKRGYTAIVLEDDIPRGDYFAVLEAVQANGGAVAVETEHVLLGWLPKPAAAAIRAARGVRAVLYDAAARPDELALRADALDALSFFNRVVTGEYEAAVDAGRTVKGQPLDGCLIERRPVDPRERPRRVTTHFDFQQPYQNREMRGRITVQYFRLDSDGTLDPDEYTWTGADFRHAADQVLGAFHFWAAEAAARGVPLSFRVTSADPFHRHSRSFVPTRTRYEPIRHPHTDFYLWTNDALARVGYGASPVTRENVLARNEEYNRSKKEDPRYGPFDGSFSVYVIYNPAGAPITFADGYRAFAMYDGPLTTVMWDSAGWGPENLGLVLTHETGHIFWACDEYYDAASNRGCRTCEHCLYNIGPRNQLTTPWIRNANCDNPSALMGDVPRTSCMMKDLTGALCPHTPAQVGW